MLQTRIDIEWHWDTTDIDVNYYKCLKLLLILMIINSVIIDYIISIIIYEDVQ